jgi:hypothetical protein
VPVLGAEDDAGLRLARMQHVEWRWYAHLEPA